jgi:hypothetical protein
MQAEENAGQREFGQLWHRGMIFVYGAPTPFRFFSQDFFERGRKIKFRFVLVDVWRGF